MSLGELKEKLDKYNVPSRWYSLDGELKSNCFILYKNYAKWEIFYMDERGGRTECVVLYNVSDAYDYLWKLLEDQLKFFNRMQ